MVGCAIRFAQGSSIVDPEDRFPLMKTPCSARLVGVLPLVVVPALTGCWSPPAEQLTVYAVGDGQSVFRTYALEFGVGARFWLSDRFRVAPTMSGLFGHTSTQHPAINVQHVINWSRSIITLSSDSTYFHRQ